MLGVYVLCLRTAFKNKLWSICNVSHYFLEQIRSELTDDQTTKVAFSENNLIEG